MTITHQVPCHNLPRLHRRFTVVLAGSELLHAALSHPLTHCHTPRDHTLSYIITRTNPPQLHSLARNCYTLLLVIDPGPDEGLAALSMAEQVRSTP